MRPMRWLFLLAVVAVGVAAEAQCLKCYRQPGSWKGICDESDTGYRDRGCFEYGQECNIPDFQDPCWWLASSGKPEASPSDRYFTTRRPLEDRAASLHRRLQTLDPGAPRCGAKTLA